MKSKPEEAPATTLAATLAEACARWPDRPALVDGDRTISYGRLLQACTALTAEYARLGVRPGNRVICAIPNRAEFMVAMGAAWLSGSIHVGVDSDLTEPELRLLAIETGASLLLTVPGAEGIDAGATRVVGLGVGGALDPLGAAATASSGDVPNWPDPAQAAIVFVTSGTTGRPKTALGMHGNLARRWGWIGQALDFGPDDVHLAHMPLAHGFGLLMAMAGLFRGGRLVLMERFSPSEAWRLIGRHAVTVLNGSPTHFRLLIDRPDPMSQHAGSLRIGVGSAAGFPAPLLRSIFALGMEFMVMYGSSEGVGVVTRDREDMLRGAVGRPAPGSVAILDPDGVELSGGKVGEIAFSRSFFPIRYWAERDVAAAPPWYRSGDYGRLDAEGRLYVLGKLKHQINRGGLHVDPVEVENALLDLPAIADAAVTPMPDPVLGEVVCACIVPAADPPPGLEDLRAALAGRLAPFKLPDRVVTLARIPRTRIGKVDLAALRAAVQATAATAGRV